MTDARFSVFRGDELATEVWREVATLFSGEYGCYSAVSPCRPGERIRLGVGYYTRSYASADYRVALCRVEGRLVAEAIYRDLTTTRGKVAFVVQLVVAEPHRRCGIASTLLHAVWGFSDYYAWGIVTSNAFTVESLEGATFRRTSPDVLLGERDWLRREVLSGIGFLESADWRVSKGESCIASGFFTDRSHACASTAEVASRLGSLAEGEEWLAVVFRFQEPDDFTAYRTLIERSSELVADAYRQMPQSDQAWAARTADEVDVILGGFPDLKKSACIRDFGAGSGRHVREFRRRGFEDVLGVDFATDGNSDVVRGDCRQWRSSRPVDLALCLYDVVGSFADDADNEAIVANLASNLAEGGRAVFSVSNWDYLDRTHVGRVDFDDPVASAKAIFALSPTTAMQSSGEFFDGGALLVDEKRRLVCHKEQFEAGVCGLPAEYLIRDRRFTAEEISSWLRRNGLDVLSVRFVRAGFRIDCAVATGKELLVFCGKASDNEQRENNEED